MVWEENISEAGRTGSRLQCAAPIRSSSIAPGPVGRLPNRQAQVADARQEAVRIWTALAGLPLSFDVVVIAREGFEETRNVIGGIAWPAARYELSCAPPDTV